MSGPQLATNVHSRITSAILDAVGHIPDTEEQRSRTPLERARQIASASAVKAALAASALSAPPGLAGMLTLLPELMTIWRLQTKMVADIAAVYGQKAKLSREQMLYCLFRATAAQAVGALVVIVGEGVLVRRPTLIVLQNIAGKIGIKVSQRLLGKGIARWLPVVGALGVGAYTYYETGQVAQTAIELFEKTIEVESEVLPLPEKPKRTRKPAAKKAALKKEKEPKEPKPKRAKRSPKKAEKPES
ncbi:MAG: EcsC family protein [Chthoniobacterales bacterium]